MNGGDGIKTPVDLTSKGDLFHYIEQLLPKSKKDVVSQEP